MKAILIATLISCTLFSTTSCIRKMDLGEMDFREVDLGEMDFREVDMHPVDIHPVDIRPVDIRPVDIHPVDIRPVETRDMGIREVDVGEDVFESKKMISLPKPFLPVIHCGWSNWEGTKCVKNPSGTPKYIVYQKRKRTGTLNRGQQCTGSSYRQKGCSEVEYTAEGFFTAFFSRSLMSGDGSSQRTGSSALKSVTDQKTISNPCSPTVYGADGKIRMLGKCVIQRRKRRNAEGLIEYFYEPLEDTAAKERVKRQGPILSTMNRDVLFLLDESGSITKQKFPLLKEMVNALLSKLKGDILIAEKQTRVAAMTFNSGATIHFDFNYSFIRADLINKINKIPFNGGGTCLKKALKKAKDDMLTTTARGARYGSAGTERLIVVLSDGCANCDASKLVDMRKQFEDEGISFVAFFIGNEDRCVKIMEDLLTGAKCYEAFRSTDWDEFQKVIDYTKGRDPMKGWEIGHSCPT